MTRTMSKLRTASLDSVFEQVGIVGDGRQAGWIRAPLGEHGGEHDGVELYDVAWFGMVGDVNELGSGGNYADSRLSANADLGYARCGAGSQVGGAEAMVQRKQ